MRCYFRDAGAVAVCEQSENVAHTSPGLARPAGCPLSLSYVGLQLHDYVATHCGLWLCSTGCAVFEAKHNTPTYGANRSRVKTSPECRLDRLPSV